MNKIVSTNKTSPVFLTAVLVAGIIALSSPSFMTTASAQSQPYNGYNSYESEYPPSYGKDNSYYYQSEYPPYAADEYKNKNDYYKSKDSVINQKFKCINNNINIVGADINQLPSNSLANGLAAQGLQDEDDGLDSNSLSQEGNNDDGINLDKNIINVCKNINNILNEPEPEEPLTCEECFGVDSALQAVIAEYLVDITTDTTISFNSDTLIIPGEVDTIEQLCPLLEGHTDSLIKVVIELMVETETTTDFEDSIAALIKCLLEAGVIVEEETPQGVSNIPGGVSNIPGGVSNIPGGVSNIPGGVSNIPGGVINTP